MSAFFKTHWSLQAALGSELVPNLEGSPRAFRLAFDLCRQAVRFKDRSQKTIAAEFSTMTQAYYFAKRFLPHYFEKNPARASSLELAFSIVLEAVETGDVGIGHTAGRHRFYRLKEKTPPSHAPKMQELFIWTQDSWQMIHAAEVLASAIRRTKVTTKEAVYGQLFKEPVVQSSP